MGSSSLTRDWTQAPCIGCAALATGPPGKSLLLSQIVISIPLPGYLPGFLILHHPSNDIWSPSVQFSSVQSLSCVRLCDPMSRSTLGLPVHHQLPEFTQTHVHWVGDAIQPSHPLSSPSPPAPSPSQHQVFSNESTRLMRWPKCWSFSFSISPSNEHPGLISFRMDWLGLLAVQGTLNLNKNAIKLA